ncbi:Rft protein-domain-containing protein [Lobosporangium transversale]|uniref:Man(5)GlcNAc(2)-PP-dolichol translocation protein RFT1 n=1 Tax=Lobosporangium transversale TaxID=64571 RepID=A0A1Y2GVH1_9FUNG|nr:Rft protein-domain-containing protein [Lobosporangium transversale]ORZ26290.1 Rft protein-domain-containing protein [Lobosporangium transversale]|eukprot:XP_021884055.1 Rft protein-domain-containing protein [Lobosporangium transversale]
MPNKRDEQTVKTSTTDEASSILSSSVQGASYLVLLQFVSRMLTFTLNQVLLRFTSAETLGIASVQLELLLNTILFLSREGVRCAAIRVSDDNGEDNNDPIKKNGDNSQSRQKNYTQHQDRQISSSPPLPGSEEYRLQKLINMVYAPIPIGAFMTLAAVGYYLSHVDNASEMRFPGYRLSIVLYGLAALIELLAEPMFMVAQYKLWFKTRVSVEGLAVIVRCVLTCALTVYGARQSVVMSNEKTNGSGSNANTMGVLAFAIAQFVYGLLTLGGFLLAFWSKSTEKNQAEKRRMHAALKKFDVDNATRSTETEADQKQDLISMKALLPRKLIRKSKDGKLETFFFDKELLKLSKTLTAQSLLKHILTEGDKMLMAGFTTEADQGVYAFVINYGSLVARILFQPMEETSRTLFSRLLSDIGPVAKSSTITTSITASSPTDVSKDDEKLDGASLTDTQRRNLVLSRDLLLTIMKFHILLGLVFIAFGTHYTATLIDLVVGSYWSRQTIAPAVLSLYCWYVPIMGLNGITEAVVQAVASENELTALSYWMVGFSAVFCSTGAFLMGALGLGAKGIVLANCVNLTMRILWSMWFLSGYYGRHIPTKTITTAESSVVRMFSFVPWRNVLPSSIVLATFSAAYAITAASEQWVGWDRLIDKAVHISIGVSAFGLVMASILHAEKSFLWDIRNIVRQRRNS